MQSNSRVPDGWQWVRLADVAVLNRDSWDPSDGSAIQYLDLTAVFSPGRLSEPQALSAQAAPSRARRRVQSGDILVSTVRPNLRGFARVNDASDNLIASTGFAVVTPRAGVSGSLLYHHVMTETFARYLDGNTTGQAYPAVRPSDVGSYRLLLPPLHEQRAIAAILDSIDEAIERTEAVIAVSERLRDALLHDLLTRGLPGGHTEFKQVRGLGTIPASWDVVRLGDVLVLNQPGAWGDEPLDADPGVRVLRAADLTRDGRVHTENAARRRLSQNDQERRLMLEGDLILERSGGGPAAPVGRVALIEGGQTLYCSNFCQHLRVDTERISSRFAARALWHRYLRGVTERLEQRTTGIRNLDYDGYLLLPIPIPPTKEQEAITALLNSAEAAIERERKQHAALDSLKASAADALLAGRLRVK